MANKCEKCGKDMEKKSSLVVNGVKVCGEMECIDWAFSKLETPRRIAERLKGDE